MINVAIILLTIFIIGYILLIYKKYTKTLPFLIIFLVYIFWGMYSIMYIDNGTYISEQNKTSYFTGASIRLILILLPLLLLIPIFFKKIYKKENEVLVNADSIFTINNKTKKFIQIFSIIILAYLYLNLIISGIPLINNKGITHFNFYKEHSTLPFASKIQTFFLMFNLMLNGVILADKNTSRKSKIIAIILYALSIFYRILFNEKFYPFLVYTVYFFIPTLMQYFEKERTKKEEIKSLVKIGAIVASITIILTGMVLIKYSKDNKINPFEHFKQRALSLQAHLFWGYDNYLMSNGKGEFNFENIKTEIVRRIRKSIKI